MIFKKRVILVLLLPQLLFSQGAYIPLQGESYQFIDRLDILKTSDISTHTAIKPYDRAVIAQDYLSHIDTGMKATLLSRIDYLEKNFLRKDNTEWIADTTGLFRKKTLRYFYHEEASFLSVNTKDFTLRLNPVFHGNIGIERPTNDFIFENRRGFELRATIKNTVTFYTFLTDNQERTMTYIRDYSKDQFKQNQYESCPGCGFWSWYKTDAFDYFNARGYVNFKFMRYFTVQLGHDKNFIGNGVRSLFLSDHSAPYFFLKFNTRIWKINYENIFAELTHQYIRGADKLLVKKYGAFHHFNFAVSKNLDIGLFEGVIMSRNKGFELQYLNPIIFYRAVEQSLGSPDNSVIGADFKWNFKQTAQLYGQFILDEFNFGRIRANDGWWGNKFGFQLGAKYINMFGIHNLDGQIECNMVMPYTFSHRSPSVADSSANYTHYNQAIGHPSGANFREAIFVLRYQPTRKISGQIRYFNIAQGMDTFGVNWGSNIFYPSSANTIPRELGNTFLQGMRTEVNLLELRASYMPWHNIYFDVNATYRHSKSERDDLNNSYFFVGGGIRMNIARRENEY